MTIDFLGRMSRTAAVAKAFAVASSLQEGTTKLGWLEVPLQVMTSSSGVIDFGSKLHQKVFEICPEFAKSINNWQHMSAIIGRYGPRCFEMVETQLTLMGAQSDLLPQSWFREAFMLQRPQERSKSKEDAPSEDEQFAAVCRLLGAVRSVLEAKQGEPVSAAMLARAIPEDKRKSFMAHARKFVSGLKAAETSTGVCWTELLDKFQTGAYDDTLQKTTPQMVACNSRFWPWVKEAQAAKAKAAKAQAIEAALKLAEDASAEASALQAELEKSDAAMATSRRSEMESRRETLIKSYGLQLRAFETRSQELVFEKVSAAEEIWAASENRRLEAAGNLALEEGSGPCKLLCSKTFPRFGRDWLGLKAGDKPPTFIFELTGEPETENAIKDLDLACNMLDKDGLVILICMANLPMSLLSSEAKAIHAIMDPLRSGDKIECRRIFFSCKEVQNTGSAILIHRDSNEKGAYLERVLGSAGVTAGCIMGLPVVSKQDRVRDASGHLVWAQQRGPHWWKHFFGALGVLSPAALIGASQPDTFFMERDVGAGDLMQLLLDLDKVRNGTSSSVVCVGQVGRGRGRQEYVSGLISKTHEERFKGALRERELKRQKSDTVFMFEDVAAQLPTPPRLPMSLHEILRAEFEAASTVVAPKQPPMHVTLDGLYDARDAQVSADQSSENILQARPFLAFMPDAIALAKAQADAGVIVADSVHLLGQCGLWPTRDFKAGDKILETSSIDCKWTPIVEDGPPPQRNHIYEIAFTLVDGRCWKKPQPMVLRGSTSRHPWAAMNSSRGLRASPNVIPEIIPGELITGFLVFRASQDIPAFGGELLWNYSIEFQPKSSAALLLPQYPKRLAQGNAEPAPLAKLARTSSSLGAPTDGKEEGGMQASMPVAGQVLATVPEADQNAMASVAEQGDDSRLESGESRGHGRETADATMETPPMEQLKLMGKQLSTLERPAGAVWHSPGQGIFVSFEKPFKKLTPRILYTLFGGKTICLQTWTRVPYAMSLKTKVYCNGDLIKMDTLLGTVVKRVYGYDDRDMKCVRHFTGEGEPPPLHWCPSKQSEIEVCEALLSIPNIEVFFNMVLEKDGDMPTMMPTGVSFRLAKTIDFAEETKFAKISSST